LGSAQHALAFWLYLILYDPASFMPLAQVESECDKEDDNPVQHLTGRHLQRPGSDQPLLYYHTDMGTPRG